MERKDHRTQWTARYLAAAMAVAMAGYVVVAASASRAETPRSGEDEKEARMPEQEIEVFSVAEGRMIRTERVVKSEDQWQQELEPEQFRVTRQAGTERAFTGRFWDSDEPGTYLCAACGNDLFSSDRKFASGCGWPSFSEPVAAANIETATDTSFGMVRTEVRCRRCGAHLGHVFEDGPKPTGLRYCINSAALEHVAPAGGPDEPAPPGPTDR